MAENPALPAKPPGANEVPVAVGGATALARTARRTFSAGYAAPSAIPTIVATANPANGSKRRHWTTMRSVEMPTAANVGGGEGTTVQFRVQFLDVLAAVIKEMHVDAHSVAGAIELITDFDWPASAVRMVILDAVAVEVSASCRPRLIWLGTAFRRANDQPKPESVWRRPLVSGDEGRT